jgi:hypothetical protein
MDNTQEANSNRIEGYFRNSGLAQGNVLANGVKGMRDAIKAGEIDSYTKNADLVNSTFSKLSQSQQNAVNTWLDQTFK